MTTVLFGAGAESSFGLANGKQFSFNVLGVGNDSLNSALRKYYVDVLERYNSDGWYPGFQLQKWTEEALLKASIELSLLDSNNNTKKGYEDDVQILLDECKSDLEKKDAYLRECPSYWGLLDAELYTLMNPRVLGAKRFWRVVSAYSRGYASLIGNMLEEEKTEEKFYQIMSDYDYVREVMDNFAEKQKDMRSYYSILKEFPEVGIVTTNYTHLCYSLSCRKIQDVAYVHGRFGLFESAKDLIVYDADIDAIDNKILFPYIFIQSGVKPIVDVTQLTEYGKAIDLFRRSDTIVIVGYRLNIDDNHINSILRSMCYAKKNIYYLDYNGTEKSSSYIFKRLNVSVDNSNVHIIRIDSDNCFDVFESILTTLHNKENT